jgi:hypothetical protein
MEICCTPVLSKRQTEAPRLVGIDDLPDKTTFVFVDNKNGKSGFKVSLKRSPTIVARCHGLIISRKNIGEIFSFFNCQPTDLHLCEIVKRGKSCKETLRFANRQLILEIEIIFKGEVVLTERRKTHPGSSISEVIKFRQDKFISRC